MNEQAQASESKSSDRRYTLREAWKRWREPVPDLAAYETEGISLTKRSQESVEWMRDTADRYFADQRDLMTSLQTRGGQLAGFAGVILGLLAPLADRAGQLAGFACATSRVALVLAAVCVAFSAVVCLMAVTRPTRVRGITGSTETLAWFAEDSLAQAEPWQLEGRTLRFYPGALAFQEWINKRKAAALFIASAVLAFGLVAATVALGIVVTNG